MKSIPLIVMLSALAPLAACADEAPDSDDSGIHPHVAETRSAPTPERCSAASSTCYFFGYEGFTFRELAEVIADGEEYTAADVIEHSGWQDLLDEIVVSSSVDNKGYRYYYE